MAGPTTLSPGNRQSLRATTRALAGAACVLAVVSGTAGCVGRIQTATPTARPTWPAVLGRTTVDQAAEPVGQQAPDPDWFAGASDPVDGLALTERYTDPQGRFAVLYPRGWYTFSLLPGDSDRLRLQDTDSWSETARWVDLRVANRRPGEKLEHWAARTRSGAGRVTEVDFVDVAGARLYRQLEVMNQPDYRYVEEHLSQLAHPDWGLRWTVHPGDRPDMVRLAERMITTLITDTTAATRPESPP